MIGLNTVTELALEGLSPAPDMAVRHQGAGELVARGYRFGGGQILNLHRHISICERSVSERTGVVFAPTPDSAVLTESTSVEEPCRYGGHAQKARDLYRRCASTSVPLPRPPT